MDVRLLKYALKRNADRNVYIGSGEKARHLPRSPLAMPYELRQLNWKDDAERDEKIAAYKIWLWQIMKDEKNPRHAAVWTELRRLREDSILLCYCYPKNCHGHVIVAAWQWARDNGKLDIPRSEPPLRQTATNETQLVTLEHQARANAKAILPPHTATGPLDMMSIMDQLAASLGTELDRKGRETDPSLEGISQEVLAAHGITDKPSALRNPPPPYMDHEEFTKEDIAYIMDRRLDEDILAEHKVDCRDCQTPPPRKTRKGIVYSVADPRYNLIDDMTADLQELYTSSAA